MGTTRVPSAEIYWMEKLAGWEPLEFWAFLIEDGSRRILLNTGFPRDVSRLHEHWTNWARSATGEEGHAPVVAAGNWIVPALAVRGLEPGQITDVLVTPLTAYATGGLDQFPQARLWLSRSGWVDFHAPDPVVPQLPRDIVFPPDVLRHLVFDAPARIRLLDDEAGEFLPGIKAWFCGAHHRSSMVFVVTTAESGRVAFTDAIFKYRNYEQNIPLGLSESVAEHHQLYARLRREADVVVPLYDPALRQRHSSLIIS